MLLSIRAVSPISNSCHSFLTELSPSEGEQVLFLALLQGLASAVSRCHRRTMAMLQATCFPQTQDGGDVGINERAHTLFSDIKLWHSGAFFHLPPFFYLQLYQRSMRVQLTIIPRAVHPIFTCFVRTLWSHENHVLSYMKKMLPFQHLFQIRQTDGSLHVS